MSMFAGAVKTCQRCATGAWPALRGGGTHTNQITLFLHLLEEAGLYLPSADRKQDILK